jgi:hypothetical protein
LIELRLGLYLGGEVGAVQFSIITAPAAATVAVVVGLAGLPVVVRVEVTGIARVAVQLRLGRFL